MRQAFTLLHRWIGLTIAAFIFVSGVTGAVISWDHELDDLLNADLTSVSSTGTRLPALDLARGIEQRDPRVMVSFFALEPKEGESFSAFVQPRLDPSTGRLFEPGYNQVFIDPVSGRELGRREWGQAWPITRQTFISFLYRLHYSLHIPEMWGINRWGIWFMGGIAVLWTLDCFVGFYLTLPARREKRAGRAAAVERQLGRGWWQRWKPAWAIKWLGSGYRINFDIHRAFGLWTWALLLILAFTGVSLNLYREVFYPAMATVSQVTPSPFDLRNPTDRQAPIAPVFGYAEIIDRARHDGQARGWREPVGAVGYAPLYGIYSLLFFAPGDDHGAAGVGPARLYYDGVTGELLGDRVPWSGTAADIFVQAQFPLHSGRILGLPGRIAISVMGIIAAALSVTGVVIWYRKRAARLRRDARLPRGNGSFTQSTE